MSLPSWPGADAAYSKAYRIMEQMAKRGHVIECVPARKRIKGRSTPLRVTVSDELQAYIDALNKGDEERIKGFNLQFMHYLF